MTTMRYTATNAWFNILDCCAITHIHRRSSTCRNLFCEKTRPVCSMQQWYSTNNNRRYAKQSLDTDYTIVQSDISMSQPSSSVNSWSHLPRSNLLLYEVKIYFANTYQLEVWAIPYKTYQILTHTAILGQNIQDNFNELISALYLVVTPFDIFKLTDIYVSHTNFHLIIKTNVSNFFKLRQIFIYTEKSWSANILFFLLLYYKLDGG